MPSFLNLPHALSADPSTLVRRGVDGGIFVGPLSIVGPFTLDGDLLFTPDNTHDIGAVSASRPRDVFVARNGNFGGRLQLSIATTDGLVLDSGLTGSPRVFFMNVTPTGWVIMNQSGGLSFRGDDGSPGASSGTERMRLTNAALVLSAGVAATIGGNLIFSADNSFDIGASGASRPRDIFVGRDFAVGGNINVAGNLTIANTSPSLVLDEIDAVAPEGLFRWIGAAAGALRLQQNTSVADDFATIREVLGISVAGRTLINKTADTGEQFQVSGTGRFTGTLEVDGIVSIGGASTRAKLVVTGAVSTDNGGYGFLDSGGNIGTASGAVNTSIFADNRVVAQEINANSDVRIKQQITPLVNALKIIKRLRVVGYNKLSKSGPAMGEYGLIGQELTESLPLALRVTPGDVPDGDGGWQEVDDFHQINYQTVFMLAVKAIQEQQERIEALELAIKS